MMIIQVNRVLWTRVLCIAAAWLIANGYADPSLLHAVPVGSRLDSLDIYQASVVVLHCSDSD